MKKLGAIGDVNPIEYGGGIIFLPDYPDAQPVLEHFCGLDEMQDEIGQSCAHEIPDHPVHVRQVHLFGSGAEFLSHYSWVDWGEVAESCDLDPSTYSAESLDSLSNRAVAANDAASHWGWDNFDAYPLRLTLAELHTRWGFDLD